MKQILLAMGLAGAILLTACEPKAPAGSSDVQSGGGSSSPGSSSGAGSSGESSSGAVDSDAFVFTRENMPRLDGSTSTAPLAQAMCAVLLGEDISEVSDLVSFNRTTWSYRNLMDGEADLLLAAEPAPDVLAELEAGTGG